MDYFNNNYVRELTDFSVWDITRKLRGGLDMAKEQTILREQLAELEHEQWRMWSTELANKEMLSPERMIRWKKLWIPYSELSDAEKEHDRVWADKTLALIAADRAEERVCKKCLRPYQSHSLCLVCEANTEDDAFDKGFETGKTEGVILATQDRAGLVEALKAARTLIPLLAPADMPATTENILAKIDSALKEVGK
jgi:hypothetical protein